MKGTVAILAFLLLAAPLGAATTPPSPAYLDSAFTNGEVLEFSLSWLAIVGGSARMTVTPVAGQPNTIRLESLAVSSSSFSRIFRVRDFIESLVERGSFSTLRFHKILEEKNKTKDVVTNFDYAAGMATRREQRIPISRPMLDPLSTIYYLRRLDLKPGDSYNITMLADTKVVHAQVTVLRRETLDTPAGTFRTVVVEPKTLRGGIFKDDDSRLLIWYTDDVRHIPVRIRSELRFGSISATLTGARLLPVRPASAGFRR